MPPSPFTHEPGFYGKPFVLIPYKAVNNELVFLKFRHVSVLIEFQFKPYALISRLIRLVTLRWTMKYILNGFDCLKERIQTKDRSEYLIDIVFRQIINKHDST